MQGEIGDEEFKEYFSQYGEIEDSVVSCSSACPQAVPCLMQALLHDFTFHPPSGVVLCSCAHADDLIPLQVLRKPDGMSRGFGFITFKDEMSVEKCLVIQHTLNNKQVGQVLKQVLVAMCLLSILLH